MSKRQSTLLDFVEKKKCKISQPSSTSILPNDENIRKPGVNDPCSTSSTSAKTVECRPIAAISFNPESEARNVDFGLYIGERSFNDAERASLLRNAWVPPESFSYPFSVHRKGNRDVKCYLSKKHFSEFRWLTYSCHLQGLLCKFCFLFAKQGGVYQQTNLNKFVKSPLKKYSKLLGKDGDLISHQTHRYHKDAIERAEFFLQTISNPDISINNMIDQKRRQQILENRERLKPIIEGVILLGRQNIAFRSHRDDGFSFSNNTDHTSRITDNGDSPINRGNFKAILEYRAKGDPILKNHLINATARSTYISKTIQNELILTIGEEITGIITEKIGKAKFFSIIFDETTDISNSSQMTFFVRYVFANKIHEDFLCFLQCHRENYADVGISIEPILSGKILADTVIKAMKDYSLNLKNCIGLGTDGCNVMLGEQKGAVQELKKTLKNALKSPCYNHALNLSVSKTTNVQSVRNSVGKIKETINFFYASPKRSVIFRKISDSTLIKLCETRWVERHESIFRFCSCFESIITALDNISNWQDVDSSSKADTLRNSLLKTEFIVTMFCLSEILSYTVNLSKILQGTQIDKATAGSIVSNVLQKLKHKRSSPEIVFSNIFKTISLLHEKLNINLSTPRIVGRQTHRVNVQTDSIEDYYRITIYIPTLDFLIEDLEYRFDEDLMNILNFNIALPSVSVFSKLNANELNTSIKQVSEFLLNFSTDSQIILEIKLKAELELWHKKFENDHSCLKESTLFFYTQCDEQFFPNIKLILQALLTFPVTVASAERSFSALKRLKTWLRSNMTQERLCGLALMHMHSDISIDVDNIINRFANSRRRVTDFVL